VKKNSQLQSLIKILEDSKINSLEVSSFWGYKKIKLSKSSSSIVGIPSNQAENFVVNEKQKTENSATISENVDSQNYHTQKAPLVGTVYLAPKPGEPNFISVGDKVKKGQKLCLIEAMKIFNEIESEFDGVVEEILVRDEDPVEFGQPIVKIK